MWDDDRMAEDGKLAVGRIDGDIAVAEGLAGDDVLMQDIKIDETDPGGIGVSGGDASWRRLGNNLRAWNSSE